MTLGLGPERALLNDTNPHLVGFYRWLQRGLSIDRALKNERTFFYKSRDRFNSLLREGQADSQEAASLFYYLNRTGYNGLCRFNRSGEFNVPFGRHKTIAYVLDFSEYSSVLSQWDFENVDVEAISLEEGDFVYADPPYDVEFTQYATGGFSWEDQERTAVFLAKHKGPVVLVNQATKRVERLYSRLGYRTRFFHKAPRRISCTGDRTPAKEIMATRNF